MKVRVLVCPQCGATSTDSKHALGYAWSAAGSCHLGNGLTPAEYVPADPKGGG